MLYVSPLKALNNDIRRNLITPLEGLRQTFGDAGQNFPDIRVLTRSGDTPQKERQRMVKRPPEILITTPESLNILLTSEGGRRMLGGLKAVILDEIHAVIGSKRGTWLITAVDRLVPLSGEFQRIGLSATIRPLEIVAEFLGGFLMERVEGQTTFVPRPVELIRSDIQKRYDVHVRFPDGSDQPLEGEAFWQPLTAAFQQIADGNQSTLFFVRGRRMAEKMTLKMNLDRDPPLAYAHHGSLSKEIRLEVERRLKAGGLKAIVATNSLELGIDIGRLDEVVLIQTPPSVSSAVQRVGRAGHRVGEVSKATVFPTYNQDFVAAAALVPEVLAGRIEPVRPVDQPLDVLAQMIVSMTTTETWNVDDLFDAVRASWPYRRLAHRPFDLVLRMLAGRYEGLRIQELKARVALDESAGTVTAKPNARLALYASGGVIPDRGNYHLRRADSRSPIGELDEEFVWEAKIGQTFIFGTQRWTIEQITHNDVLVRPGDPASTATPFWRGELPARDPFFSTCIGEFLAWAEDHIDREDFGALLAEHSAMDPASATRLASFLKRQRSATRSPLPHHRHVLVERVESGPGGAPGRQLVIHTLWGGRVNGPLAIALQAAWEQAYGHPLEVFPTDDAVVMQLPHDEITGQELFALLEDGDIESLLRRKLEGSGLFGAQFRECAGRALLIERQGLNRRLPLWMSRLKSQKLLAAVSRLDDFPILLETWRTCLRDVFDLDVLKERLDEIRSGAIAIGDCVTPAPSPMALDATFDQINKYMYETDEPGGGRASALSDDLIRQVAMDPALRPVLPASVIADFLARRRRLAPGYSPASTADLVDWVRERWALSADEWEVLREAMVRDHGDQAQAWTSEAEARLLRIHPEQATEFLWTTQDAWPLLREAFGAAWGPVSVEPEHPAATTADFDVEAVDILAEWLGFVGPVDPSWIHAFWGWDIDEGGEWLADLEDSGRLVRGNLDDTGRTLVCEAQAYETLLRMLRRAARPELRPLPAERLPHFLAQRQGMVHRGKNEADLEKRLDGLLGFAAPAALWESEILPARMAVDPSRLVDGLLAETGLIWMGTGEKTVTLIFEPDRDLITSEPVEGGDVARLFPDPAGRYDTLALATHAGQPVAAVTEALWQAAWLGAVTADSLAPLRKGVQTGFKAAGVTESAAGQSRGSGRMRFARWKGGLPQAGLWRLLPPVVVDGDPVSETDRQRDRVRLLLDRYGVLFKALLERELPLLRWPALFRTLRLMELSGEVVAGQFFEGVPGLQFAAPDTLAWLRESKSEEAIFWMNAADPASACGLPVEGLRETLPRRVDTTHLVYRGDALVLISQRQGKALTIHLAMDDPDLPAALAPLRHLLQRSLKPVRRIVVETINGENAAKSPYTQVLRSEFETQADTHFLTLYRKIH